MESDILKSFIGRNVEILISGTWVEGHLMPIAKGIVVLKPLPGTEAFLGPTSCKTDVIQAIREVKRDTPIVPKPVETPNVHSSFDATNIPGNRFVVQR